MNIHCIELMKVKYNMVYISYAGILYGLLVLYNCTTQQLLVLQVIILSLAISIYMLIM